MIGHQFKTLGRCRPADRNVVPGLHRFINWCTTQKGQTFFSRATATYTAAMAAAPTANDQGPLIHAGTPDPRAPGGSCWSTDARPPPVAAAVLMLIGLRVAPLTTTWTAWSATATEAVWIIGHARRLHLGYERYKVGPNRVEHTDDLEGL